MADADGAGDPEAGGDAEPDAAADGVRDAVDVGAVDVGVGVDAVDAVGAALDGAGAAAEGVIGLVAAAGVPDHGRAISSQTTAMITTRISSTISLRRRYTAFDGRGRRGCSGLLTVTG